MPPVTPVALAFFQNRKDDLRFAFRTMRKSLGFTAVAVFSLALGIGANTAIFTLIDAVLLKSLPVENPGQLYVVTTSQSGRTNAHWTYPDYVAVRDRNQGFSGTIAYSSVQPSGFTAGSGGDTRAELAAGAFVSGNYFDVLGVKAAAGTLFNAEHDRKEGAAPYIVLSHSFWQRRFASDPRIIGSTVRVNGFPLTILGITRAGFTGVEVGVAPDFFTPIMMRTEITGRGNWNNRNNTWLLILGRIKPGATIAQLETELTVVNKDQELQERKISANPRFVNEGRPCQTHSRSAGIFFAAESIVRTARAADGHRRRRSVDRVRECRKSALGQSRFSPSRNRGQAGCGRKPGSYHHATADGKCLPWNPRRRGGTSLCVLRCSSSSELDAAKRMGVTQPGC